MYSDKLQINGLNYDISISEGKLFFSEYEDNPYGRNNGTSCDLKEFHEKSSEDALRVHALIQSLAGEGELRKLIEVVNRYFPS